MDTEPTFYTYVLIDPRNNGPFYVGKGTKKRMYEHSRFSHNRYVREVIDSIGESGLKVIHEKWFESDDSDLCLLMEISIISFIGRENLCNLTRGGQNPIFGENHPCKDPIVRARISAAVKRTRTEEFRARISAANTGKRRSPEVIEKLRKLKRGHYHPSESMLILQSFENEGGFIPATNDLRHQMTGQYNPSSRAEAKLKISQAMKGNSNFRHRIYGPHTAEARDKMRLAKLGKKLAPFSAERRERMRQAKLGSKNGMFGRTPWNRKPVEMEELELS
jgi:hypothetical protein